MIPSGQGLYLWAGLLYRLPRRPVLIPWTSITGVREVRELWWKRYELKVADVTTIRISRRAYEAVRPFLLRDNPPPNITLQRSEARDARLGR